jgi:hypothetical protein
VRGLHPEAHLGEQFLAQLNQGRVVRELSVTLRRLQAAPGVVPEPGSDLELGQLHFDLGQRQPVFLLLRQVGRLLIVMARLLIVPPLGPDAGPFAEQGDGRRPIGVRFIGVRFQLVDGAGQ